MHKLSLFSCLLIALITQSIWAQSNVSKPTKFKKSTSAAAVPSTTPPPSTPPSTPAPTGAPTPPPVTNGGAGAGSSSECEKYKGNIMHAATYKSCLKCLQDKGDWNGRDKRCRVRDHRAENNPACLNYSNLDPRKKQCNKCFADKGTWRDHRCSVRDHR